MTLREALEGLAPDTVLADDTRTVLRRADLGAARGADPPSRVALAMRSVPAAIARWCDSTAPWTSCCWRPATPTWC